MSHASLIAMKSNPLFALLVRRCRSAHGHRRRTLSLTRRSSSVLTHTPRHSAGKNCVRVDSLVILLLDSHFFSQAGAFEEEAREESQETDCFQGIPGHSFRGLIPHLCSDLRICEVDMCHILLVMQKFVVMLHVSSTFMHKMPS